MFHRLWRHLRPRITTHLFLCRSAVRPEPLPHEALYFHAQSGSEWDAIERFAVVNGFPRGWVKDIAALGGKALAATDPASADIMAMGWLLTEPLPIEEMGETFNPAGKAYLFGDFAAPAWRGRRLQRFLVNRRLALAAELGLSHALTIIEEANIASLRSYGAEGFQTFAAHRRGRFLGRMRTGIRNQKNAELRLVRNSAGEISVS